MFKDIKDCHTQVETGFDNQGPKATSVPFVRVEYYGSQVTNGVLAISGSQQVHLIDELTLQ